MVLPKYSIIFCLSHLTINVAKGHPTTFIPNFLNESKHWVKMMESKYPKAKLMKTKYVKVDSFMATTSSNSGSWLWKSFLEPQIGDYFCADWGDYSINDPLFAKAKAALLAIQKVTSYVFTQFNPALVVLIASRFFILFKLISYNYTLK